MTGFNSVNDMEAPAYDGYYVGTVVANNDPKKLQRVKVSVPSLLEGAEALLPWVAPLLSSPFGFTSSAGVVAVPVIGARVVVEFQEGQLYYGLLKGSVPTAAFTLPTELATNYPGRRGWKDPAGNVFFIDNTAGANTISVQHASGAVVSIANNGDVLVSSPTKIDLTAPVTNVNGAFHVTGAATMDQTLLVTGNVTAADLGVPGLPSYSGHYHTLAEHGDILTTPPIAGS